MEGLRHFVLAAALSAALVGCGSHEATSAEAKPKDAFAGLSGEAKVDAIRKDPTIGSMQKSQAISDAQKAAGLPITGQ